MARLKPVKSKQTIKQEQPNEKVSSEIRPNEYAVKTIWGWSDKRTGEILVSDYGKFIDELEAEQSTPNGPITMKNKES